MKTNDIIEAINEISQERELDRNLVIATIEEAILLAARKKYVEYENLEVALNHETGEFELTVLKEVTEEIEDPNNQITLKEAREKEPEIEEEDFFEHRIEPKDFGNIIAQTTRMMLFQKIREIEREHISQKYSGRVRTIVHGKVGRVDRRRITVLLNDNSEAVLEYREQIPSEKFQPGENIRCLLLEVRDDMKGPQLYLSRRHPDFLRELFDQEIPEVYEKLIKIVNVARDPGRRAKVAVTSSDPDVDPVGACVGPKGSRIQPIVSELNGERIDIIEHSENITVFIREALSPGKVVSMTIDEGEKIVDVEVEKDSLSAAIGRQGQNVKLASILTKYTINVTAEKSEDEVEEQSSDVLPNDSIMQEINALALSETGEKAEESLNSAPTEEEQNRTASDAAKPDEDSEEKAKEDLPANNIESENTASDSSPTEETSKKPDSENTNPESLEK